MTISHDHIVAHPHDNADLWQGGYKIPWNDPGFSSRMLREHLSQDHQLASRSREYIEAQAEWLRSHALPDTPAAILDLCCGPGLYSPLLAGERNYYIGIDFSPASIGYAKKTFGAPGKREFLLADVTEADYGGLFQLAMLLYGECNVFPPRVLQRMLSKAHGALAPGGRLVVERQRFGVVRASGQAPAVRTRAGEGGLFSDSPYVCLTKSRWVEEEAVAVQYFDVLEDGAEKPVHYRSTTKAWTAEDMERLLIEAGFGEVVHHDDWPVPDDGLALTSAVRK